MGPTKHESFPSSNIHLYTWLVVLTVEPAWRSFLTTLEWPLEDAIISAVVPFCEMYNRHTTWTKLTQARSILPLKCGQCQEICAPNRIFLKFLKLIN